MAPPPPRFPFRLQVTPMEIPEAIPQETLALEQRLSYRIQPNLAGSDVMPVGASTSSGALVSQTAAEEPLLESDRLFSPTLLQEGKGLLVQPGKPSEIVIQVQNLQVRPLHLNFQIKTDLPSEWCQLHTEGSSLAPQSQTEALLYVQVPPHFFEDPAAIAPQRQRSLKLDYRLSITVISDAGTNLEAIQQETIRLFIRPAGLFMEFLPVLFREVDFMNRFMQIFEQAFKPVIQSYSSLWAILDSRTAPESLLPFLAHWVAWPLDPVWNLSQQRRLIRRAVELYRWRGTRKGLRLYLHLYTGLPLDDHLSDEADKHISITEPFGRGFILGESRLGEDAVLGGGQPYHFVVRLRTQHPEQVYEPLARKIIEQEKPAFCTYELSIETEAPATP